MLHPITFGVVGQRRRETYEYLGDANDLAVDVRSVLNDTSRWNATEIMVWNPTVVSARNSKRARLAKLILPEDIYPDHCIFMYDKYRDDEPIVLACVEALQYVAEHCVRWNGSEPLKIVVAPYEKLRTKRQIRTGHYRTKWNKSRTSYKRVWRTTNVPCLANVSPAWHVENEWVLK